MSSPPQTPTFVVAGAARAGSTAVTEALRAHPHVFVTRPKEPHYFALSGRPVNFSGPGDDTTINRVAVTDVDQYRALYPLDGGYRALGEGSVSTLYYHSDAVPAIREMNDEMRIVIVLREPLARAFSSFQYLRVRGFEPLDDFLDAVEAEPRRRQLGWHHLWHYTAMSHYAESVAAFVDTFGDQVGVWFHDDLEADAATTIEQIQRFVGVDPVHSPSTEAQRVNASGQPRQRLLQEAMQWAGTHAVVRSTVKRVVPFAARERIRNANLKPGMVTDQAREALGPLFAADLLKLQETLGRPLPTTWLR